jgi:hypothetical protein
LRGIPWGRSGAANQSDYKGDAPMSCLINGKHLPALVRTTIAATMAVVALLALGVGSASALVVTLADGTRVSVLPTINSGLASPNRFAEAVPPLTYHGGPVMPSNTNYTIYWAPKGSAKYDAGFTSGVNKYFKDLAKDSKAKGLASHQNVDSVAAQYEDSAKESAAYQSTFGGAITVKDPYPASGCGYAPICLTEAQLTAEIKKVVESHGLPRDLKHEYFLLTPPGVESCFEATGGICSANSSSPYYCAFHSYIPVTGGKIVFSNDPYVANKNCDETGHHPNGVSDSALLGGLSHEHNESITDPQLNAWYDEHGAENGDKCRTFNPTSEFGTILGTAPDGSPYNQVINKALYFYQQEFSNIGNECKQRL